MIYVKEFSLPPFDRTVAAGYAGIGRNAEAGELALVERAHEALRDELVGRVCYTELPVATNENNVRIGTLECRSRSLAARLLGCTHAVIFTATVGQAPDRLIARYARSNAAMALAASAVGSERVEALCDLLCEELRAENATRGRATVTRFSPGYGDLSLDFQREIFGLLAPHRRIGVMLGESLIMSPSKSVTAIVGIKPRKENE